MEKYSILLLAGGLMAMGWLPIPAAEVVYTETMDIFPNPERGFYAVGGGNGSITNLSTNYQSFRNQGYTLVYGRVNLEPYANAQISQSFLNDMSQNFARMRSAGVKTILRITYNDGPVGGNPPTEASLSRVIAHLTQMQPILEANKDVIAFVQAGIIGAWGEWNSTLQFIDNPADYQEGNAPSPQGRASVINALLQYMPQETFIQVRRPWFKDPAYGAESLFPVAVNQLTAFTDAPESRIGHHNDCFLSSSTDYGTYHSASIPAQKAFVASDTRYVPLGGETCNPNDDYANCENGLEEMETLRWTYLNNGYHPDVLNRFRNEDCYDEIDRRLGYRMVLNTMTIPDELTTGEPWNLTISLENKGFAPVYTDRPVYLRVLDQGGEELQCILLGGAEPRRWLPGSIHQIEEDITLDLTNSEPTAVTLALWLPDVNESIANDSRYAIRFANQGVWDSQTGDNILISGLIVQPAKDQTSLWILR